MATTHTSTEHTQLGLFGSDHALPILHPVRDAVGHQLSPLTHACSTEEPVVKAAMSAAKSEVVVLGMYTTLSGTSLMNTTKSNGARLEPDGNPCRKMPHLLIMLL